MENNKETIELTLEQAKEFYLKSNDEGFKSFLESKFTKKLLTKKSGILTERIKTFEDVLEELGEETLEQFEHRTQYDSIDEKAYKKLKLIVKCFNEGWVPDWKNSSEFKYFPWFTMGGSSGVGFSYCLYAFLISGSSFGGRLCLKSLELAKYVGTTFLEEYKEWMTIPE
jgi:hypothetical protein